MITVCCAASLCGVCLHPYRLTYYFRPLTQDVYDEFRKYYENKASLRDLVGIDGELCSQD